MDVWINMFYCFYTIIFIFRSCQMGFARFIWIVWHMRRLFFSDDRDDFSNERSEIVSRSLFSFKNMFDRVTFQVVLLATGFLLDTIGLEYMVVLFGVLSLLLIVYTMFRKKEAVLKGERAQIFITTTKKCKFIF